LLDEKPRRRDRGFGIISRSLSGEFLYLRRQMGKITRKEESFKVEPLNCLKRQDALSAFIRKYLLFPGRDLLQDLI